MSDEMVESCLTILELEKIPDDDMLRRAFNRLIKKYHPDRNPERKDWAHEKTRLLIEASRKLRSHIENGRIDVFNDCGSGYEEDSEPEEWDHESSSDFFSGSRDSSNSGSGGDAGLATVLLQLVGCGGASWAFFLHRIKKIVEFREEQVRRYREGSFYVLDGLYFPYVALTPETVEQDFAGAVILYGEGAERKAFYVGSIQSFGEIIQVSRKEFLLHKGDSGKLLDASVFYNLNSYRIPREIIFDAESLVA